MDFQEKLNKTNKTKNMVFLSLFDPDSTSILPKLCRVAQFGQSDRTRITYFAEICVFLVSYCKITTRGSLGYQLVKLKVTYVMK